MRLHIEKALFSALRHYHFCNSHLIFFRYEEALSLIGIGRRRPFRIGCNPFLEFQPVIAGDDHVSFNFQGGITGKVHPNIALGAGFGITEKWNFEHAPLIPIFGRAQFETRLGSLNPFLSLDVGYEINTDDTHWGAVLVNPMIGLKFGRWYGGIGYLAPQAAST